MELFLKDASTEQANRKFAFYIRHQSGPKALQQENNLRKLPNGAPVMV